MSVTFVHTADWQIGKAFANFEGDAGALLRAQRLMTVERIAKLAAERNVDAVLVAGDVFESNTVSDEMLRRTLNAMRLYSGSWVLLPGNHDSALSESVWTRLHRLGTPGNVFLALKPEPLLLADGKLAVLPAPLARRHEATDITEWFDSAVTPPDAFRVGLAHGSVANRLPQKSDALNMISDTRSESAKLDYLALGDWHGTLEIAPRTWYSGTPEPERFRNNEPGNVLIVTLTEPGGAPGVEVASVGHFGWKQFEHTISSADDVLVLDALLAAESQADRLVASLTVRGTVDLATRRIVEELIDRHRARCHFLRTNDEELVGVPSDQDLDRIDTMGFVRAAIEELRAKASNPSDSDSIAARAALQKLYLEHLRLGD